MAKGLGQLIVGAIPAAKPRGTGSALRMSTGLNRGQRDLSPVVQRNIFCAGCEPVQPLEVKDDSVAAVAEPGEGAEAGSGEPVESSLEFRLLATLVCVDDPAYSYAALLEPSESNKVGMYAIGSKIGDEATVTDIMDRRVLLDNAGRPEYIDLASADDNARSREPRSTPKRTTRSRTRGGGELAKLNEQVQKGVRKLGPNKWEIQRSALNKVLSNTTLLARSARIVPSLKDGKPNGFKLYAIRPGSIYSLIGMKNGDTIQAVNGRPMTTPDKALEVYTKVRNASHLTISFSRRGKTQTHDYLIR
jgi:general secretion pathway protein C